MISLWTVKVEFEMAINDGNLDEDGVEALVVDLLTKNQPKGYRVLVSDVDLSAKEIETDRD